MKIKQNMLMKFMIAFVVMFLMVGWAHSAQIVSVTNDSSIAFRIENGYTNTLTWVVGDGSTITTNTLSAGAEIVSSNIICRGTSTNGYINTLGDAVLAMTNTLGDALLTYNAEPSLALDLTTVTLLAGTYTAASGEWLEVLWDTSTHLSYDVYLPSRTYVSGVSAYILGTVVGVPGDTGDVTVSVYKGGVLVAQQFITSPVYVNPSTYVDAASDYTNTLGVVNSVSVDWELNLPFTGKDAVIVRATRATTAASGVLSAVIPNE